MSGISIYGKQNDTQQGSPAKHVFKMALAVTCIWMPSSNLWRTKSEIWTSLPHSFTKPGRLTTVLH